MSHWGNVDRELVEQVVALQQLIGNKDHAAVNYQDGRASIEIRLIGWQGQRGISLILRAARLLWVHFRGNLRSRFVAAERGTEESPRNTC